MKSKTIMIITLLFYLSSISFLSVVYSFSNTDLQIKATSSILLNHNNSEVNITENGKWNENNLVFYNFNFSIKYTGNNVARGYRVSIKSINDLTVHGCYNAVCTNDENVLVITQPNYFYQIEKNQSLSFSIQVSTKSNYYYPTIINVEFFENINTEDLGNKPFEGFIEDDLVTTNNNLVWNFNDKKTGGWFIEGSNDLVKFNNGYALGIKNNEDKIMLRNNNIDSIKSFNKYKTLSYRLYVPVLSNLSLIKYSSFVYNRDSQNLLGGKFTNDNLDGMSVGSLRKTVDGRYFVLDRIMEKKEIIKENCFTDIINLVGNYNGYVLIDSIKFSVRDEIVDENINTFTTSLEVQNSWDNITQFNLNISSNKNSIDKIESWEIHISLPEDSHIVSIWSGNYVLKENTLIITPESWNSEISPDNTINIGMQIKNEKIKPPLNANIIKATAKSKKLGEVDLLK